ncbi:UTP:RNA uridylyltransferase 1 [Diplonema papillatum]|nr:UTP:RNA uridylyltransferase 1 [Diplonema papillatum]KAJ9469296.1 UTP:RNA uridylyltransferase 1 [Diplonema papillatum]
MEEPSRKRRREDEEEGEESEERVPKKFRVVMRDVAAGPVRMEASVAEEAVSLWRAAKPSEAEKRKEADLLAHLKRIAAKWMHKATVNLYGSRATGIGATTGDDVDATITWPGYNPEKSADKAMEEAFSKKLTKLCITLHQKGFQSGKVTPCRTLTLVKCHHEPTGWGVDLTFHNAHALANTKVLTLLSEYLPELSPAVHMLKTVGRARGFVNKPGSPGFLSTYCLVTMLVVAAQNATPQLLPKLPTEEMKAANIVALDEYLRGRMPRVTQGEVSPERLSRLVCSFLTTFHTDAMPLVASASELPSPAPAGDGAAPKAVPYIRDIIDGSNAARSLSPYRWLRVVGELGRLIDLIRNRDPFAKWLEAPEPESDEETNEK